MQTTTLVHEAYLRLIDASRVPWQDRAHFFAIAAQVMRRVSGGSGSQAAVSETRR